MQKIRALIKQTIHKRLLLFALCAGITLSAMSLAVHHDVDLYSKPLYSCRPMTEAWRCMGTYLSGTQHGYPIIFFEKFTLDQNTYVNGKHSASAVSYSRFALNSLIWAAIAYTTSLVVLRTRKKTN